MNTKPILESLGTCLQILQPIPFEIEKHKAEIEKARKHLLIMRDLITEPIAEALLYDLRLLKYDPDHVLFRVTAEDFAGLLADYMAERGVIPADLAPDELEHLISTACDYLNGEGMPWADVIKIALDDAWPERLKGSDA
jgi:hypothetical protein